MASTNHILICTDLDRTLLPNGSQPESSTARPLFRQLVANPEVKLAYVSGRDRQLLLDAIKEYDIPLPDYAITDVGTTIYGIENGQWQKWQSWYDDLAPDWGIHTQYSLAELLDDINVLQLQEDSKQGKYKLSYYADPKTDTVNLFNELSTRFHHRGIRANLDIIANAYAAQLRHFDPALRRHRIAETIGANYDARMKKATNTDLNTAHQGYIGN